ncbi:UV excision repair protein RAD23 homolog B [Drosophila tropicalis]|uniref:UV excision repair protein RAD23 homolog B n=1 Tax=Drosophila tropicalis TaxID=46794 RepID=UPI0035AB9A41
MIITVKNLQQQTFTIDFDPEKTVLELKKNIFEERGAEYLPEKQKLIYAGVILVDDRKISSYKVDEKKFIVVMLTRDAAPSSSSSASASAGEKVVEKPSEKKTSPEPTPAAPSPSPAAVSEPVPVPASVASSGASGTTSDSPNTETTVSPTAPSTDQTRAESSLLMGEEYNRTVSSMVEMGYPREQVERAMAASFNNPERAVEYLINGIPAEEEQLFNDADPTSQSNPNPRVADASSISAPSGRSTADPFEFLRSQPQFLQMRSLIYQNPQLLDAVLQQIGQTNPALLQLISENQDAFLNMLNQPLEGESSVRGTARSEGLASGLLEVAAQRSAAGAQETTSAARASVPGSPSATVGGASERENTEQQQLAEGVATIRLNPQDQDAIERLKALGFPEALVLQAYFACEKDEELAANFLLSSSFDD